MNTLEFIQLETFCQYHQADLHFIQSLHQFGLVELREATEGTFIPTASIPELEKMIRLNQELEINVAGIDVVLHLLARIEGLQMENAALQSKLMLFEAD